MTRFHFGSSKDDDLMYLLGYYIADPFFFLETKGTKHVFLSPLDIDAFRAGSKKQVKAIALDTIPKTAGKRHADPLAARALDILDAYGVEDTICVPTHFPLHLADALRDSGVSIQTDVPWCPERTVKTVEEAAVMEDVAHSTVRAFQHVEQMLSEAAVEEGLLTHSGEALTSERIRREVELLLLNENVICSEGIIVSCGAHAAMPHECGRGPLRPHEPIIVDIFPRSRDSYYFSDMTRSYVKGKPSEYVERMYEAVAESQRCAREALRPGVSCAEMYEISAQVIRDAGFDVGEKGYIHSLGHGVGVAVHEEPSLSPRSHDVLKEGNVVTVEPGLYYPEHGGIRIEDTVLITKSGYNTLTEHDAPFVIA